MTTFEINQVALSITLVPLKKDCAAKRIRVDDWIARREKTIGVHGSELRRFFLAVKRDDLDQSFTAKRAGEIGRALFKHSIMCDGRMPNKKIRDELFEFAILNGIDYNELLETAKDICTEIIADALAPDRHQR